MYALFDLNSLSNNASRERNLQIIYHLETYLRFLNKTLLMCVFSINNKIYIKAAFRYKKIHYEIISVFNCLVKASVLTILSKCYGKVFLYLLNTVLRIVIIYTRLSL